METRHIVILIIFIVLYGSGRKYFGTWHHFKNTAQIAKKAARKVLGKNSYEELRLKALSITPEDLGLAFNDSEIAVYGVVIDWEMRGYIATIVAFKTGDASLYLSSGGGVIGGGQHSNINKAAKNIVEFANQFTKLSIPAKVALLPETNKIRFHFLTNKGLYTAQEFMHNIDNETSSWLPFFTSANELLSELRLTSEK